MSRGSPRILNASGFQAQGLSGVALWPSLCRTAPGCSLHLCSDRSSDGQAPRGKRAPMNDQLPGRDLSKSPFFVERALTTLQHFLHVEAVSGVVLLAAAAAALLWANSPFAHSYHDVWNLPVSLGVGEFVFARSLHFWINDALMTVFFLVVGMEIRREIHEGALSRLDQAVQVRRFLAALGGIVVPALIYLSFNAAAGRDQGWAIPTASRHRVRRRRAGTARKLDSRQRAGLSAGACHHRRYYCGFHHRVVLHQRARSLRLCHRCTRRCPGARLSAARAKAQAKR